MSREVRGAVDLDDDVHMFDKGVDDGVASQTQSVGSKTPVASSSSLNEIESSFKGKSDVWQEMTKTKENGVTYATCNHCIQKLVGGSKMGTSHLRTHLGRCKKRKSKDIRQLLLQAKEKKDGKVEFTIYEFNEEKSRNDLANMIAIHEYPLSMVDHYAFRIFVRNLQPLFAVKCRNTIKGDILKIYHSMKQTLIEELEGLGSRVAITTDMWSARPTKKGFMAMTAHYIDASWVLQNRLVRFVIIQLDKIVGKLDVNMLLMRGEICSYSCAHILNLIVKDGLEVIKKEVEKVRNSVIFWIGSRSRIQKFEDTARQLSIPHTKALVLDCPTRWNSTYMMLEIALLYKAVFPRLKQKEKSCEKSYTCLPDEEEWIRVEKITEKLKLFNEVTVIFSATTKPTANEFFPKICDIKLELNKWVNSVDTYISDMAKQMLEKYDKYWKVCHEIMGVACVLDPRFKMKLLEFYLPCIHGENAFIEIEKIRKICYDLLHEYQKMGGVNDNVGEISNSTGVGSNVNDPLSNFDKFVNSTSSRVDVKSELDHYLEELVVPRTLTFDVLAWWKTNGLKFPTLQKIARDILAIPISSVASESAFSTSGRLISPHRSRLAPNTIEALMCTQNWLRNQHRGLSLDPGGL